LATMAQELGLTFLCSAHLNKGGPGKSAIHRIMGGTSYVNTFRVVYVLGRDPDDDSRRILASPKCNLPAGPPPSIVVRLDVIPEDEATKILAPHVGHLDEADRRELAGQLRRVRFDGEAGMSADDVLG